MESNQNAVGPGSAAAMVAPPKADTKLVSPSGRKQWVQALQPCATGQGKDTVIHPVGTVFQANEKEVKEFCDRHFTNAYSFEGERTTKTAEKGTIVRAKRITPEQAREIQTAQGAVPEAS